jgi:hypothetical protein
LIKALENYWYFLVPILGLAVCVAIIVCASRPRRKGSVADYFLLWPILLDQYRGKASRRSKRIVILGAVAIIVLTVFGVATSRRGRGYAGPEGLNLISVAEP